MKELKILERILNNAIKKGVFQSMQEVAEAINCLDNLNRKISSMELQIQELQKGANNS